MYNFNTEILREAQAEQIMLRFSESEIDELFKLEMTQSTKRKTNNARHKLKKLLLSRHLTLTEWESYKAVVK